MFDWAICVCDDHPVVAEGIEHILSSESGMASIHKVKNAEACLKYLKHQTPDLLVLDLNLPDMNGIELLKKIRESDADLPVLVLTMYKDPFILEQIKKLDGNGYLLKDFSRSDFLQALDAIKNKRFYVAKGIKRALPSQKGAFSGAIQLTRREKEIITFTASGKSAKEVAQLLHISKHTVNTHRRNIYKKLNINGIKELIRFAHKNGLA